MSSNKKPRKINFVLIATLSLLSIGGSFYTEFHNSPPCFLCLTIRYSVIAIFLISLVSLFLEKIKFTLILPIAIAFWADLKLINQEFFKESQICEGNVCQTPEFFGIRLSIWALLILSSISVILLLDIIMRSKKKQ